MKRATRPPGVKIANFKLGRRIQKVRTAKKITQEQLAEKIGTGLDWIAHIETGREVPNIAMLRKIARALGVKVQDLIPF
jgi:transcriptional regulator with XRE-family HTH domain